MIIFDTNALFGLSPDDPKFDLLRALKQAGQQQVGIPWMVQEELVAQRVLRHAEAHRAAVSATGDLNRVAPWLHERGPKPFNRGEAGDYWRKAYGRLFEVVETSGDVARQALLREANCEKPAKGQDAKDKGGARDAAIWLSVVEYLKANPDEKVYFVTGNTRDFGDGTGFPAPMSEDIEGLEYRLALLTSFDAVVSEFSTPLDIDEEHIQEELAGLLTSEAALTLLGEAVREQLAAQPGSWGGTAIQDFLPGLVPGETYRPVRWTTWVSEPQAVLRCVQDVAGHKIGEDAWYTATVDWILVGTATVPASSTPLVTHAISVPTRVACQWRTKLLFSNRAGEPPVLLAYWAPEALDAAEQDEWQPLVRKAVPNINLRPFDIPSSPLAIAIMAAGLLLSSFASKKQPGGGASGNPGGASGGIADTPEIGDPPDSST